MKQQLLLIVAFVLSFRLTQAQTAIKFIIDPHGNVTLADSSALNGPRLTVSGNKLVFTITPVAGHQASVTVPGHSVVNFRRGQLTIPDNIPNVTMESLSNKSITVTIDHQLFRYALIISPVVVRTSSETHNTLNTPATTDTAHTSTNSSPHQPYVLKTIYYDALALSTRNYLTKNDWIGIIKHYYGITTNQGFDSLKKLVTRDSTNPYLAHYLNVADSFFIPPSRAGAESSGPVNLVSQGLSAIGGLDVTSIADGFAKFLVKRTKQELTIAFFSRFYQLLSKSKDLQTVFPQTYQALSVIGDEIYNYQGYILTLREGFEKDLSALLTNLPTIVDNHPELKEKFIWLKGALESACYIAQALRDKTHPGQIIANYPDQYLDSLGDLRGAVQTLQLLSASLHDTASNSDTTNYWIGAAQLKKLIGNDTLFRIYIGLLCQQGATIKFPTTGNDSVSLKKILVNQYTTINPLITYVSGFANKALALTTLLNKYKKAANDSIAIEQYYTYFTAAIGLIRQGSQIAAICSSSTKLPTSFASNIDTYCTLGTDAAGLLLDINRRNYSSAILNATAIYGLVFTKPWSAPTGNDSSSTARNGLFQYGSFMAALVQAKSSDDVENAIEAFALPSGSSRIKRESTFNVSLNAYTGFFLGNETIKNLPGNGNKNPNSGINSYGVAAPIGVAISWGGLNFPFVNCFRKVSKPGHWSYSLFVSVVDIGAVAAFRFNDTVTSSTAQIQLKDIISPGAFLSIGIPKCPLSVNLGAQVGPNLRKVYGAGSSSTQTNDYANKTYWRFSASLLVDIPLLNFYTRPKTTK